jgi:pimeloyl-ACP methyl ester carboxylesterase
MKTKVTHYKNEKVEGVNIFYREAGDKSKPTILLLNGFPSSSIGFRDLINDLSDEFHLVAPDYPAFGNSDAPSKEDYEYSFHNLSVTVEKFIDQIGLKTFALYAFDYGGPVGYRIAVRRPELISALIIQNANAYMEGIGPGFGEAMPFLKGRNSENEKVMLNWMTLEGIKKFYLTGIKDASRVNPDGYNIDLYYLDRPGVKEIHLDILQNYTSNLGEYPKWQAYFKQHQPPTLLVWGAGDIYFPIASAKAYKTDLPNAELHAYDTAHFALEEHHEDIAENIREFMKKNNVQ